jgi:hypothetical protein
MLPEKWPTRTSLPCHRVRIVLSQKIFQVGPAGQVNRYYPSSDVHKPNLTSYPDKIQIYVWLHYVMMHIVGSWKVKGRKEWSSMPWQFLEGSRQAVYQCV